MQSHGMVVGYVHQDACVTRGAPEDDMYIHQIGIAIVVGYTQKCSWKWFFIECFG